MEILGFTLTRTASLKVEQKSLQLNALSPRSGGGWWPMIRESFTGAWQQNVEVRADTVLTYFAVYACVTLIASDIAKLCLRLVEKDAVGIWNEIESPAFSPVLSRPNHFQDIDQLIEQWVISKLLFGNAYILKERDNRLVVTALYVLDPTRVTPLVTPNGDVYYELRRDDLSGQRQETITVPASDIIHDRMPALYHPLIGVSPIYACGVAAMQGLSIQNNSTKFFSSGSTPGGIILVPGDINQDKADAIKAKWIAGHTGVNYGQLGMLTGGMTYQAMTVNAVDAQLIEQLKWTAENVCSCFHVAPYMIGVGPPPPYANVEPLLQAYYNQGLQSQITGIEKRFDQGLALPKVDGRQYGTEFDISDLIWMDAAARTSAAKEGLLAGLSPDEVRKDYYGKGPVKGGDTPYLQVQNYSLAALAKRDADDPFAKTAPQPPTNPMVKFAAAVRRKSLERWRHAA